MEVPVDEAGQTLSTLNDGGAIVTALWRPVVGNVLLMASRRGRLAIDDIGPRLSTLDQLPIAIDEQTNHHGWSRTPALAQAHRLTLHDAYSELAQRRALSLASHDRALNAATSLGLPLA